jgi:hypothetical protein
MKSLFALALLALTMTSGCHAQLPTTPTYSCPAAAPAGTYATLNAASPATGTTYVDSGMASGTVWCYVGQTLQNGGTSGPSNIVGPSVTPSTSVTHAMTLNWTIPADTPACTTSGANQCTYVISRIPAVAVTPTAPGMNTTPTISEVAKPTGGEIASSIPAPILTLRSKH